MFSLGNRSSAVRAYGFIPGLGNFLSYSTAVPSTFCVWDSRRYRKLEDSRRSRTFARKINDIIFQCMSDASILLIFLYVKWPNHAFFMFSTFLFQGNSRKQQFVPLDWRKKQLNIVSWRRLLELVPKVQWLRRFKIIDSIWKTNHAHFVPIDEMWFHSCLISHTGYANRGSRLDCLRGAGRSWTRTCVIAAIASDEVSIAAAYEGSENRSRLLNLFSSQDFSPDTWSLKENLPFQKLVI